MVTMDVDAVVFLQTVADLPQIHPLILSFKTQTDPYAKSVTNLAM